MHAWPISVELKTDESISSWLIRVALTQGCDPIVLTGLLWPDWRAWTFDLDRGLTRSQIDTVIAYSTVTRHRLEAASLFNSASKLTTRTLPKYGVWPWVQALGARNRLYRGGLQFCPLCFNLDKAPSFRRGWRFSWVTACSKHQVQLIDRCSICQKPIEPHRLQAINTGLLSQCATCGCNFRDLLSVNAHTNALHFQQLAQRVLNDNGGVINECFISAQDWFDTCRYLLVLIRRSVSSPNSALTLPLQSTCQDILNISPERLTLPLEFLGVTTRVALMDCLFQLISNLQNFSKNLVYAGVSSTCLSMEKGQIPHSLYFITDKLKPSKSKIFSGRSRGNSKPKSKVTVMKSWARLKRKYRQE